MQRSGARATGSAPTTATATVGKALGWWDGMIGPGKAFDTDRYFVISTNLLGGCRGTTGPSSLNPATGTPYGSDFPVITVADMVRTERAFLDELGIERLAAVAGGSLGGMQAFEWAITYPDQIDAVVAIASTHALHPQGLAWNAIAREAIMRDPEWQGGRYDVDDVPGAGMGVARMIGHITYLSAAALHDKFGRRLQFADDIRYTITEPEFEVESYLRHQADSFVKRFDPNTYVYTSRALTYFDLAREHGGGSLTRALEGVKASTLLIAFSSDWLYPPSGSRDIEEALRALGKPVELHVIDAPTATTASCWRRRGRRRSSVASSRSWHDRRARRPRRRASSASRRASSTPGSGPTRTPAPAQCRSSRRPATSSRTRSPLRPTSTCRSTATPTRAS